MWSVYMLTIPVETTVYSFKTPQTHLGEIEVSLRDTAVPALDATRLHRRLAYQPLVTVP